MSIAAKFKMVSSQGQLFGVTLWSVLSYTILHCKKRKKYTSYSEKRVVTKLGSPRTGGCNMNLNEQIGFWCSRVFIKKLYSFKVYGRGWEPCSLCSPWTMGGRFNTGVHIILYAILSTVLASKWSNV